MMVVPPVRSLFGRETGLHTTEPNFRARLERRGNISSVFLLVERKREWVIRRSLPAFLCLVVWIIFIIGMVGAPTIILITLFSIQWSISRWMREVGTFHVYWMVLCVSIVIGMFFNHHDDVAKLYYCMHRAILVLSRPFPTWDSTDVRRKTPIQPT